MINNINGYIGITIPASGVSGLDGTVTIDEILSHPSEYDECVVTLANLVNDVSNRKLINKPIFIMDRIEDAKTPISTYMDIVSGGNIIIPTAFSTDIENGNITFIAYIKFDASTRKLSQHEI